MQSTFSINVLCLILLLLPWGIYLLLSGLRGRRIGADPRCRECGYLLLHLSSPLCPECGTPISPANTVHGERRRSWGKAITGALLAIVACLPLFLPLTRALQNIPWYHYKPSGWVLDDLDSPPTYLKAIKELDRREAAGQLPASVRGKLIEKALQEQASTTSSPRQDLLNYLGTALLAGHLTQQQKDRFVDQACSTTMTVRPIVAEGDKVPFWVWDVGRGPQGNHPTVFWARHSDGQRRIDGKAVRSHTGGGTGSIAGGGGTGSSEPAGAVGKHTIEADRSYTLWYGPMNEEENSQLIGNCNKTVRASYEVLPADKAPKIGLLDSPELRRQVIASIKLPSLSLQKNGYLNVQFQMTAVPCDLAFEVSVQTAKGEMKAGSICCAKGKSSSYGTGAQGVKDLPANAKVILRSSPEVAKNTVDQTAIYSGQIEFPDVVVEQSNY